MEAPQLIDLQYDGKRHWFNVYRYQTMPELHAALYKNNIREFPNDTIAYTDNYPNGEHCGAMYLLDTSIDTLAHEATHMALGIIARSGHTSIVATTDEEPELSHDLCKLVGAITSELYSKNKYY